MVVTRKIQYSLQHLLSTRKINASSSVKKYFPTNVWCADCNDSINLGDRKKLYLAKCRGRLISIVVVPIKKDIII